MLLKGNDVTPDYRAMYCKLFCARVKVVDALQYAQAVIEQVQRETEGMAMESPKAVCLAAVLGPCSESTAEIEQDALPTPHTMPESI